MTEPVGSVAPDIDSRTGDVPRHIAIIMDGNNRWAKRRGLPGTDGHKAGEATVQKCVENCSRAGIEVLTLFAFSSENWRRPAGEVAVLMSLFLKALERKVPDLHANGVRLRFIGDLSAFATELQAGMRASVEKTAANKGLTLNVAVNYGGQWDMANAARELAQSVRDGEIRVEDVTPERFAEHVQMSDLPPVDLLIRTGGELRLSNFLLWQAAYAELVFLETLWPDFDDAALNAAIAEYASRQRRFGRTSEQVEASLNA